MTRFFKNRSKKTGLPPGSLVHIGDIKTKQVRISLVDYDEKKLVEKHHLSPEECLSYIETPAITWIQVCGISDPKAIETIGTHFKLHPLILEDILNSGQRSKIDMYQDYLFIVMRLPSFNQHNQFQDEQISLILGKNLVISFVENEEDIFEPIRERIRKGNGNSRIRKMGADYLMYSLLDMIVDYYFVILEKIDNQLEELEEELVKEPSTKALLKIQHQKRMITLLRKSIWPTREVINQFQHIDNPLINSTTRIYLNDVYDHTIQAIDTIEGFRDIAAGMLDLYISNINLKMNEIMKVLTVMATIFVPLTFIASIYGMNFENMPELHYSWGYPAVLLAMFLTALTMLVWFRYKSWI